MILNVASTKTNGVYGHKWSVLLFIFYHYAVYDRALYKTMRPMVRKLSTSVIAILLHMLFDLIVLYVAIFI